MIQFKAHSGVFRGNGIGRGHYGKSTWNSKQRRGFKNPLLLHQKNFPSTSKEPFLQISNPNGFHWVVATNTGCDAGSVRLYDSLYTKGDASTDRILSSLLQTPEHLMTADVMNVQQQKGGSACGVFAIALRF